jgi:hypothetical protein
MSKGLGIAAFVIVLLSVPIPVVGSYLCILGLLLGAGAALGGNKVWPVVVSIVGGINLFFMSPSWAIVMYSKTVRGPGGMPMHTMESTYNGAFFFTLIAVLAPIAIVAMRVVGAQKAQAT